MRKQGLEEILNNADNKFMGRRSSHKQSAYHRPNGLIAELRASAPAADKKLIAKKSKEAKAALKAAVRPTALEGISSQMLLKILSSR